jgi:hypothetical protein
VIDLGLPTNELLVFEDGTVTFVDKKSIRDSLVMNSGQFNLTDTSSVFERIRNKTQGRLNSNTIQKIGDAESPTVANANKSRYETEDERRSMKSATRSLSIKANPQAALAVRTSIDRS